jgi:23S rRNA pseudouridine1911/1915/1917 synthase
MSNKPKNYSRKGEWLQMVTPQVPEEQLFRWLAEQFSFPEKLWKKLLASGGVQFSRQRLSLRLFQTEELNFEPQWEPLDVVYDDDFMLIINKPSGLKIHPTEIDEQGTLVHFIAGYYVQTNQQQRIRVVHRLDQDTSGLVVFAKGEFAQLKLDQAMQAKQIERTYHALVQGHVRTNNGIIDAAIGRDRHQNRYRVHERGGKAARTNYQVMKRWNGQKKHSLLQLHLETGRTHQIRVHLSHIGHPLLGDYLYGGDCTAFSRQALHAVNLTVPHPWNDEQIVCNAPYPTDFQMFLKSK